MKLKQLRECYRLDSDGVTWVPKTKFETEEAALNTDNIDWIPYAYECGVCNKYHIASLTKQRTRHSGD